MSVPTTPQQQRARRTLNSIFLCILLKPFSEQQTIWSMLSYISATTSMPVQQHFLSQCSADGCTTRKEKTGWEYHPNLIIAVHVTEHMLSDKRRIKPGILSIQVLCTQDRIICQRRMRNKIKLNVSYISQDR